MHRIVELVSADRSLSRCLGMLREGRVTEANLSALHRETSSTVGNASEPLLVQLLHLLASVSESYMCRPTLATRRSLLNTQLCE